MPVTSQEQDPAEGAARAKQASEPSLYRLRGSLVGTRYEFLKTAAFSAVFTVSLCMMAGGAGLLSPDNQFYVDARAAVHGLAGHAASNAGSVGAQIQVAAASAAHSVSDRVSHAMTPENAGSDSSAPAGANAKPEHGAAPAAGTAAAANQQHAAKAAPPVHRKVAHHHHHKAAPAAPTTAPAPVPQQAIAPAIGELPGTLNDELAKAYYGVVNFFAERIPSAGNSARGALDSFTRMLGLDSEPATFDPSHPETVFQILTSTSTLIMVLGVVLFLVIAGVFVMSVKDGLRNMSRRLRTKRTGGYA